MGSKHAPGPRGRQSSGIGRHPFLEGLSPTLHIAHRGGATLAPENTMVAFEAAVSRYGTDMIELDVHRTADGEIVVFHDDTLDRCTNGHGPIAEKTLAELQALDAGHRFTRDGVKFPWRGRGAQIPTLAEVLTAWPDLRLNIEVKPLDPQAVEGFVQVLKQHNAVDRCCVGSALDRVGGWLYEALPEGCHFYPQAALARFIFTTLAGFKPPLDPRYTVLDMPLEHAGQEVFTPRLKEVAAETGRWINVWTVDDLVRMRRLIDEGVGGIMTDRPDLLLEALASA